VGRYVPTESGPIALASFTEDGHYTLELAACDVGSTCTSAGTFRLSEERTELSLTDDATGRTSVTPFDVTETEVVAASAPRALRPLADPPIVDDPDGPLIVRQHSSSLIRRFVAALTSAPNFGGKQAPFVNTTGDLVPTTPSLDTPCLSSQTCGRVR
jgi:hypothetical protein